MWGGCLFSIGGGGGVSRDDQQRGGGGRGRESRAERIERLRREAYEVAKRALEDEDCKNYLKGTGYNGDPLDLLKTLYERGQFREGGADYYYNEDGSLKDRDTWGHTVGRGENATIDFRPPRGGAFGFYDASWGVILFQSGLTNSRQIEDSYGIATLFLHELGHATGRYSHKDGDADETIGNSELTQGVFDNCIYRLLGD
jgi:hypothetical protein